LPACVSLVKKKILLTFRWLFSITAEQQEEQEDDKSQDKEIKVVEEEEDDCPAPPPAPPMHSPPPLASTSINMAPSAPVAIPASGKGISWIPIQEKHPYRLNQYDHMMYIIDMPTSFSSKPGSYKLMLCDNGFDLSILAPPPLTDPHHVHSSLSDVSGRRDLLG
jgi:hypothetical protein